VLFCGLCQYAPGATGRFRQYAPGATGGLRQYALGATARLRQYAPGAAGGLRQYAPGATGGLHQVHRELQEDQSEATKSVATNHNSRCTWLSSPTCTGCDWRTPPSRTNPNLPRTVKAGNLECLNVLNNSHFCFHVCAQKVTYVKCLCWSLLNNFCFNFCAQKSLLICENVNAFF